MPDGRHTLSDRLLGTSYPYCAVTRIVPLFSQFSCSNFLSSDNSNNLDQVEEKPEKDPEVYNWSNNTMCIDRSFSHLNRFGSTELGVFRMGGGPIFLSSC